LKDKNINIGKDAVTIISSGVIVEGKLSSNGNVRIDGTVNGDITANGNLTIGNQGEVTGEVHAQIITVGGKISGTITAHEKIILESTSLLKGDIITKILVVEEGAVFEGKSSMSTPSKMPSTIVSENKEK
jgi:cytoskeletal protein CcmA (bactofilin family)